MYLESDSELPYYKPEVVQTAQETKHQAAAHWDPSHLQARACHVQKEDTATLKERHWVYYMGLRSSITIALTDR